MGSCIGTIHWNGEQNQYITNNLTKIAERHNVDVSSDCPALLSGNYSNNFTVSIEGLTIWWRGGETKCMNNINNFLNEVENFLNLHGIDDTYGTKEYGPP